MLGLERALAGRSAADAEPSRLVDLIKAAVEDEWLEGSALTPPLVVTQGQMDQALDILERAITDAARAAGLV